jgi:hypothetical protein
MSAHDPTAGLPPEVLAYIRVVRRNSVNRESMYSKEGLIRVDIIKHTRNDIKPSIRLSAMQMCQLALGSKPALEKAKHL